MAYLDGRAIARFCLWRALASAQRRTMTTGLWYSAIVSGGAVLVGQFIARMIRGQGTGQASYKLPKKPPVRQI